jgi:hypothetical protein
MCPVQWSHCARRDGHLCKSPRARGCRRFGGKKQGQGAGLGVEELHHRLEGAARCLAGLGRKEGACLAKGLLPGAVVGGGGHTEEAGREALAAVPADLQSRGADLVAEEEAVGAWALPEEEEEAQLPLGLERWQAGVAEETGRPAADLLLFPSYVRMKVQ